MDYFPLILQPIGSFTDDTDNSKSQWTEEEVIGWLEFNTDDFSEDFVSDNIPPEFTKWTGRRVSVISLIVMGRIGKTIYNF